MASSTTFVCVGTRRCACTHKPTPHAHTDRQAQADDNACAHTANDTVHAHTADDTASPSPYMRPLRACACAGRRRRIACAHLRPSTRMSMHRQMTPHQLLLSQAPHRHADCGPRKPSRRTHTDDAAAGTSPAHSLGGLTS